MADEEKLREIKTEQEPTQVTWRRCTQCNAAQMEFQLRKNGICQECYTSNLEKENAELNNQLYDLKESYNKIIDEVIENAKSYGLISETCLWQYINEYDNKEITYDELYEKLLSVAVQELKMAIEDMKERL